MSRKYTDKFIVKVLNARNNSDMTHKELRKKFKLTQNQLTYILYQLPKVDDLNFADFGLYEPVNLTLWERIKRWFS